MDTLGRGWQSGSPLDVRPVISQTTPGIESLATGIQFSWYNHAELGVSDIHVCAPWKSLA
jgi:hypothetical protein